MFQSPKNRTVLSLIVTFVGLLISQPSDALTIGEWYDLEDKQLLFTQIDTNSPTSDILNNWLVNLSASTVSSEFWGVPVDISRYTLNFTSNGMPLKSGLHQISFEVSPSGFGYPALNNIFFWGGFFFNNSFETVGTAVSFTEIWTDKIDGASKIYDSLVGLNKFPIVLGFNNVGPASIFVRNSLMIEEGGEANQISNVIASPLPEPLTILGASTAIAFGSFFKRKTRGHLD